MGKRAAGADEFPHFSGVKSYLTARLEFAVQLFLLNALKVNLNAHSVRAQSSTQSLPNPPRPCVDGPLIGRIRGFSTTSATFCCSGERAA